MKRFYVIALLVVVGLAAASPPAHALGVFASWWNMDESDEGGFGFGVRQKIPVVPVVSIDTRASYMVFSDADLKVYPLEAAGMVNLGLFYGGIGVGYYIFDADNADLENNFGWWVAGGVELGLAAVSLFGEVKWTEIEADYHDVDPNLGNVPTSIDAAGVGFNAGVMFGF
jgi:hypothetical protein